MQLKMMQSRGSCPLLDPGQRNSLVNVDMPLQKKEAELLVILFRCVLASLYEGLSVRPSVGRSVGPSVGDAFVKNGKIDNFDRK